MSLKKWLRKPYPLLETTKDKLLLAFSFGIFVYLFLLVFEPFDADKITNNKSLFLSGFGVCVFTGLVINYFILPYIFPIVFNPEKWQIKKEILYIVFSFTIIAIFNYSYNTIIGKDISQYRSLFNFLGITVAIGMFPVVILTFLIERNLNKKNTSNAEILSKYLTDKKAVSKEPIQIQIESEALKSKPLGINLNDFVFAKSDNNYSTIFYFNDNELKHQLLRLSFRNLEDQLSEFKNIIRCHRSYIVNKHKIKSVKGNARSLLLEIENYQGVIPVSRNFPKENLV